MILPFMKEVSFVWLVNVSNNHFSDTPGSIPAKVAKLEVKNQSLETF